MIEAGGARAAAPRGLADVIADFAHASAIKLAA
jgi:hypothetical protein